MKLKEWMRKNYVSVANLENDLNYRKNYLSSIISGRVKPGKKLAILIEELTEREVTKEELGYIEKEKCRCPTCGRIK